MSHSHSTPKPITVDVHKVKAAVLEKSSSTASAVSTASATTAFSTSSTSSSATSASSQTYKSSSYFHSSSFRSHSQEYLIQDTCSNLHLKGSVLHLDFKDHHGHVTCTHIDLDQHIGIVNGRLEWDSTGFFKKCEHVKLDGHILTAKYHVHTHDGHKEHHVDVRLDLYTRLRISGGIIVCIETDKKLSKMLSEVPWMKFKVIAEPDLSVFSSHPVIKHTLTRIAESTVEHVTLEMHKALTIAMEAAIIAITASAMKHVSIQMEQTVLNAVGCATASPSVTEAECLHIIEERGGYSGGGYGNGTYAGVHGGAVHVHNGADYGHNGAVHAHDSPVHAHVHSNGTPVHAHGKGGA